MNSCITLTEKDLLDGIHPDGRIDIIITHITQPEKVQECLERVVGDRGEMRGGEIFVRGNRGYYKNRYSFGDLLDIMSKLTGKDGCPWDLAQTHESIRSNMIEEAYELVAAINNADTDNIREETGDVLLQAVFHADIASRNQSFDISDVITELCAKLVSRHTHIFGDTTARSEEEALDSWNAAKAKEKSKKDVKGQLADLSQAMPALLYAQKAIKKLAKDGLKNNAQPISQEQLFSAVAGAVKNGIDAEVDVRRLTDLLAKGYFDGEIEEIK